MEYVIGLVAIYLIIKLNGSFNQLLGMGTSKLDVLEIKSAYEDAKAVTKVGNKVAAMDTVHSTTDVMKVLRGKTKPQNFSKGN